VSTSRSERGLTFRSKLVLALLGAVAAVLIVALLAVREETGDQITRAIERAATGAQNAFGDFERVRQSQLQRVGAQFAGSNRVPLAFQQALEGDTAFLRDQISYDLGLAGVPSALAAFVDPFGNAIYAQVDGKPLDDPEAAVPLDLLQKLIDGDTAAFGYHRIGERLYSAHPVLLQLVEQPVGFLILGSQVDAVAANAIGQAISAEVCFAIAGVCLAGTPRSFQATLLPHMVAHANRRGTERIEIAGERYAFIAEPFGQNAAGSIVLALPLGDQLAAFDNIQKTLRLAGFAALELALLLAILLSRSLTRPVHSLVAATERVRRGEYNNPVNVITRDELGTLAHAFNEMMHGLLLKDQYRGVLDKVVSREIAEELLKGEISLGGENRLVTTLFADIRGFTPLTQGMEPQRVIALLNEVMACASRIIEDEGGVVDKFVGDEVMALFGAPMSRGDDVFRAARAAVRIQQEIEHLNEERPHDEPPVRFGIGINTGIAVAGNMGSPQRLNYTVLGESVNLASRLCDEAKAGQVLISHDAFINISDRVEASVIGTREVKGFAAPVLIYELVSVADPTVPALAH